MRLLYLQSAPLAQTSNGVLGVHHKTASGLQAFKSRWDGEVAISCLQPPRTTTETRASGLVWQGDPALDGISVLSSMDVKSLDSFAKTVVHAPVNAPGISLLPDDIPLVLGDDNSPRVRTQLTLINSKSAVDRFRIRMGAIRRRQRFDAMARKAVGFHANGFASYSHYHRVNESTLRYFDHRVSHADLTKSRTATWTAPTETFHIAFSGRLESIKGVQFLPAFAEEMQRRGRNVKISVVGSGSLESELRRYPLLKFPGFLDFETQWKPFFRDTVDLTLLPHIQGDSSSTYYESLGMGVPVIGFANDTLTPLIRESHAGWTVSRGNIRELATLVEAIIDEPSSLHEASSHAIEFMSDKSLEDIFDMRIIDFRRALKSWNSL